ncbi:MAG: LicD family protein, partial [Proteobacteria bacterium]|nr:LicD family protein [Pseudomonadota bacterium]
MGRYNRRKDVQDEIMDEQNALAALILTRDIMAAIKLRYFLTDGTLLGIVRDNNFIASDSDIDIGVFAEDFNIFSFGLLASLMRLNGFSHRFLGVWGKHFAVHWTRKNVLVDVSFYFKNGDQRVSYAMDDTNIFKITFPADLIETLAPIEFRGHSFTAPKDPRAILSYQYGDWSVPRPDWDWKESPLNIARWKKVTLEEKFKSKVSNR